ncbi:Translation machinery-associated protein 22 [Boothiomyces sp. JEL0838]|nr:Translation machinery-associated protein 22 [Boothiomyces sp. JEL0838]KAJ3313500.1 Translation machinery-associated protein 22 [Boothiomyces sp. JEL0838]
MSEGIVEKLDSLSITTRVIEPITYCGVCSMPPEYCEFGSTLAECKAWLQENDSALFAELYPDGMERAEPKEEQPQEQKQETKKKKKVVKQVVITITERTKRKRITNVKGLELFDVDLKKAAKTFANKFATSGAVVKNGAGQEEIAIGGDVSDDIFDFIVQNFGISEDDIEFGETKKK